VTEGWDMAVNALARARELTNERETLRRQRILLLAQVGELLAENQELRRELDAIRMVAL